MVHDKVVQAVDAWRYAKQIHEDPGTEQRQKGPGVCVFEDLSQTASLDSRTNKFGQMSRVTITETTALKLKERRWHSLHFIRYLHMLAVMQAQYEALQEQHNVDYQNDESRPMWYVWHKVEAKS